MGELILIVLAMGGLVGLVTLLSSNKGDPKERSAEAAKAALTGTAMASGFVFVVLFIGIILLLGIWLLVKLFAQ